MDDCKCAVMGWYGGSAPPPEALIESAEDEESRAPEAYALRRGRERGPLAPMMTELRQRLATQADLPAPVPGRDFLTGAATGGGHGSLHMALRDGCSGAATWLAAWLAPPAGGPLRIVAHRFEAIDPVLWHQFVRHRVAAYTRFAEIHLLAGVWRHLEEAEAARDLDHGPLRLTDGLLIHQLVELALLAEGCTAERAHECAGMVECGFVGDELARAVNTFFLVAGRDAQMVLRAEPRPAVAGEGLLPAVLVVDDSAVARQVVSAVVRRLGLRAIEAEDGPSALLRAQRHRPVVIILDLGMPGMGGIEVLTELRARHDPDTPVIVVTSSADGADVRAAAQLGARDYLIKPVDTRSLQRRIEHYAGAGRDISE